MQLCGVNDKIRVENADMGLQQEKYIEKFGTFKSGKFGCEKPFCALAVEGRELKTGVVVVK